MSKESILISTAKPKSKIRRYFSAVSWFLAKVRSIFITLATLFFIVYFVGFLFIISSGSSVTPIPESGTLRVDLNGMLVDQKTYTPHFDQILNKQQVNEIVLRDIISAIHLAAKDQRINSMVLLLDGFQPSGTSKIEELGIAVNAFKETGKPVLAYGKNLNKGQYLIASYANDIYLHQMGMLEMFGLSSYRTYMKDALDKLNINIHLFRTGPHKNLSEPFIANKMSPESSQQIQQLIDAIWAEYEQGVMTRRDINKESFDKYTKHFDKMVASGHSSMAEVALEMGFVDHLVTSNGWIKAVQAIAGKDLEDKHDHYQHIDVGQYYAQEKPQLAKKSPKIAYIAAVGNILDGEQPSGTIGGDTLVGLLKMARTSEDKYKALVLRVDSGGGSAFASELIRNELQLLKEQGIPIVISMGSVAASGGYWISTNADEIWASPTTITGSIGVTAMIPTVEDSFNALGLHVDGVETSSLATMRLDLPLREQHKTILQSSVNNIYDKFIRIVSSSREIQADKLREIAGGRVWTGTQAKELGLVDFLGDQQQTIDSAAKLANIEGEYQLVEISQPLEWHEKILQDLLSQVSAAADTSESIQSLRQIRHLTKSLTKPLDNFLRTFNDPRNIYVYCEACPVTTL